MFLDGQKLRPYIPMAKARGFTGVVNKQQAKQAQKLTELTSDLATSFEYLITAINNKDIQ